MSWRFDKSEVPQFEAEYSKSEESLQCVACREGQYALDRHTGLCRPCWRVVILGPAMESWRNDNQPPLRSPGTRV